jgi:hypothetical protein
VRDDRAALEGATLLDPERLDAAIMGVLEVMASPVAVYDYDALVRLLQEDVGDLEETEEWVDYNTLRAIPYMGPRAPVVLRRLDDDPDVFDPEELVDFRGKKWLRCQG